MSYSVVILTAGIGSRLNKLTKNINKSLVSVSNKPVLSHIIDQFPKTCKFIIALGHKGELVKQFLQLAYSDRKFYFVEVDKYRGTGSGLGYSLLCCEKYLQEPFIFTSCDTLVKNRIHPPKFNWLGSAKLKNPVSYRTIKKEKKTIKKIQEKGKIKFRQDRAYIGLAGIKDYKIFWEGMRNGKLSAIKQGEVYGLNKILKKKIVKDVNFNWFDTGTLEKLLLARSAYKKIDKPNILEKENEKIWFLKKKVIKFSTDNQFIYKRVKRAKELKGFVPEVIKFKKNMYSYKKIEGQVISQVINVKLFKDLLIITKKFWNKKKLNLENYKIFKKQCHNFYFKKTKERINLFYKIHGKKDEKEIINGKNMPTLSNLLDRVDWDDLKNGFPVRFHGDFHFENILYSFKKKKFTFLDWRQDFSGNLKVGDIYYDLAKLLHGLIVSHESIMKNKFKIQWKGNKIFYDLKRKKILKECEDQFRIWCKKSKFSYKKVRILTALIYLNIAALHHYPYSLFLYAIGKFMLKKELDKK
ncbi:MAG: nucleoside-diphosphate-sugar pyrophosphorylase [Candidatus Marinimicrobia bacterium]|nr:nucleoside-diphosphate-sugar pyrophosphorylase [Candidatus Neomarinimicrobiota bacterium]